MRIGISPFASSRQSALDLSATAVAGGLDTLWLGDGYLSNPDFRQWAGGMESMTELAWLSGAQPTARIGITAAVLAIRDVVWTAKQANTLQRVAGGGFVLVVTPGFWRQDLEARGVNYDRRGAAFAGALDRILEALIDDSFSPGPSPDGAPAVWLAGAGATMERAIERRLTFQSSRASPAALAPIASDFFERGGTTLAHRVRIEVGDHHVQGDAVDWHAVTGSPDEIVDALGQYRELGVTDLSVVPGQDDAMSMRTVRALIDNVLPQLG